MQTGYEHHSPYWEARVERNAQILAREMQQAEEDHPELDGGEPRQKTVDLGEVYDGITMQTGYEHHSDFYY